MTTDLSETKRALQEFFTDGMVLIIGSGLSVAEGVPGMGELADSLLGKVNEALEGTDASWEKISSNLKDNISLETALLRTPPSEKLLPIIERIVCQVILNAEQDIIEEVICNGKTLKLQKLFSRILKPSQGLPVITTNYDRLVEVAAEASGLQVDTMFCGQNFAKFSPEKSRALLKVDISRHKSKARYKYLPHIALCKPHGSLDWFLNEGSAEPIRSPFDLNFKRLMITPGAHKYKSGYDKPFDAHREAANRHITKAARFLIIGYGFNDDHLETHLSSKIKSGAPTLLITHTLSENAQKLLESQPHIMAITSDGNKNAGSLFIFDGNKQHIEGLDLWDIENFDKEVFSND